jgi:predicted DNA-binding protein
VHHLPAESQARLRRMARLLQRATAVVVRLGIEATIDI